jgi:neutral ceramidase
MALSAGAAAVCITPLLGSSLAGSFTDRKAIDVHDDLYARALVVSDESQTIALVVCDLICCPREVLDRAKELAHARVGIPPSHITISCTHTHTGPATAGLLGAVKEEAYTEGLAPKIADSIQMAFRRMQPAVVCWGVGSVPDEVHNRRWHMKDGTVKMNPPVGSPDLVRPAGPTDPDVGVLAFEQPDGTPIAALVNYALHYVGGGDGRVISADYFALVEEELNRMMDAEFPVLVANGCSGDINNINFREPNPPRPGGGPWAQARHVARVVAAEATKVWEQALRHEEAPVAGASAEVTVERRSTPEEQLAKDREVAAKSLEESGLPLTEWQFARERIMVEELPRTFDTVVTAGRIGDAAWTGLPGEIFCAFGLAIKEKSPFGDTMPIGLANDYLGYVCTPEGLEQGGYETMLARSSLPTGEGGWELANTATRLLSELAKP